MSQDEVGGVGEEAAKLLAALQGWAREHLPDPEGGTGRPRAAYIADGSAACRVCPLCQAIAVVRGVNPESLDQLGHAAGAVLSALTGLVDDAHRSERRRQSPVQRIDLADDTGSDRP